MSYFSEIYGDPELSARAKQVLVYLHDRANQDGESWYAIGTMAKDLSLSCSTIKRALTELIRQGPFYRRAGEAQVFGNCANGVPALAVLVCPVMEVHQYLLGPGAQFRVIVDLVEIAHLFPFSFPVFPVW